MGDVIDFSSRKPIDPQSAADLGDGCELTYEPKPGSVGVSVVESQDGVARFNVTAPAEEVAKVLETARTSVLAGFGLDAANPEAEEILRRTLGASAYDGFIVTFVQQHFFAQALLRTNIMPFLDPTLLTSELPVAGEDYTFRADVLTRPFFELTGYDPVKVSFPEKTRITSKDVTLYLDNMASELGTWEPDPTREAVAHGDRVQLNLDATVDGKPFQPLTGRHVPYLVGTCSVGEEFDRALEGMKPRERKEVSVSLPAPVEEGIEAPQMVQYQVVQVKVQIDEILHKVPARIDDAWVAQNLPEAQTLLGLRSRIRDVLERDAEAVWRESLGALCTEELAKRLKGEPGEAYAQKMRDELVKEFMGEMERQGIGYQQLINQPDFDVVEFERHMLEEARATLRRSLALDSLADHLDIQLEEKDIAQVVASMYPGQEEAAYQSLLESGQMPKLCESALRRRATDWLVETAVDVRGPKLQLV